MKEPLVTEERIAELIAEYPTHSDKWLLCKALIREAGEAAATVCEDHFAKYYGHSLRKIAAQELAAEIRRRLPE